MSKMLRMQMGGVKYVNAIIFLWGISGIVCFSLGR